MSFDVPELYPQPRTRVFHWIHLVAAAAPACAVVAVLLLRGFFDVPPQLVGYEVSIGVRKICAAVAFCEFVMASALALYFAEQHALAFCSKSRGQIVIHEPPSRGWETLATDVIERAVDSHEHWPSGA